MQKNKTGGYIVVEFVCKDALLTINKVLLFIFYLLVKGELIVDRNHCVSNNYNINLSYNTTNSILCTHVWYKHIILLRFWIVVIKKYVHCVYFKSLKLLINANQCMNSTQFNTITI